MDPLALQRDEDVIVLTGLLRERVDQELARLTASLREVTECVIVPIGTTYSSN